MNQWQQTPIPSQAKRKQLEKFEGLLPERQGHYLASTLAHVPNSLDTGSVPFVKGNRLDLLGLR